MSPRPGPPHRFRAAFPLAAPWLAAVLTLGAATLLARGSSPHFSRVVTHACFFALIPAALLAFPVVRHVAERLRRGDADAVLPAYLGALVLALTPSLLASLACCLPMEAPAAFRLQAVLLFQATAAALVTVIFVGALRAARAVLWSLSGGVALGALAASALRPAFGESGLLAGVLAGQLAALLALVLVLFSGLRLKTGPHFAFIENFRKHPAAALLAPVAYLALWADRLVVRALRGELAASGYEAAGLLAQLCLVPAMAVFFLAVEDELFASLRAYDESVAGREDLGALARARGRIAAVLGAGLGRLLRVQLPVSLCVILLAPHLFGGFTAESPGLAFVRLGALGALLLMPGLIALHVLVSLELYAEGLAAALALLMLGGGLAGLFPALGLPWDGWAPILAAAAFSALGVALTARRVRLLEYLTFTRLHDAQRGGGPLLKIPEVR